MAKNRVIVRLTGSGTYEVPAGVTELEVYGVYRTDLQRITAGSQHSFGVLNNGKIITAGLRNYVLNPDPSLALTVSMPIATIVTECVSVSGKSQHFAMLDGQGRVFTWGNNTSGELGDGQISSKSYPVCITNSELLFRQVAPGAGFTGALTPSGAVYAWGVNTAGQLGDNTVVTKSTPVLVLGGHSFVQIGAGQGHFLALKANGEVWAWGRNTDGELGDGTTAAKSTPVLIAGGLSFAEIAVGFTHSMARQANGAVYCWGSGSDGELGDNTAVSKSSPVAVTGGLSFARIFAGNDFSFGLLSTGVAYSWGRNASGTLGDNTLVSKSSPVLVVGGHSYWEIQANTNVIAIRRQGDIYAWGANSNGGLGINTGTGVSSPVASFFGQGFYPIRGKAFLNNWRPSGTSIPYNLNDPAAFLEIMNRQVGIEFSALELVYFT